MPDLTGITQRLRGLFGSRRKRREQQPTITCAVCAAEVTAWSTVTWQEQYPAAYERRVDPCVILTRVCRPCGATALGKIFDGVEKVIAGQRRTDTPLAEHSGEDSDPELTLDMSTAMARELDDDEMAGDLSEANERLGTALCEINEALGLARGASAATAIDRARILCAAYRAQAGRQDEIDRRLTYIRGLVPGDLGGAIVLASGVEDRARAVLDALAGEVVICLDEGGLSLSWRNEDIVIDLMPGGRVAVLIEDQDLVPDAPKSGGNHAECVMTSSFMSPAPSVDDTAPHWRCSCGDWQMAVEPWPLEVVSNNTAEAQRSWAAHAAHRPPCTPSGSEKKEIP